MGRPSLQLLTSCILQHSRVSTGKKASEIVILTHCESIRWFAVFSLHSFTLTTLVRIPLISLKESHPEANTLLLGNGFSVNRSDVARSRSAVDITIEQTVNRHAKSQSGIIGFSRNHSVYYRWCNTRQTRASFLKATREMVDMDNSEDTMHVHGAKSLRS